MAYKAAANYTVGIVAIATPATAAAVVVTLIVYVTVSKYTAMCFKQNVWRCFYKTFIWYGFKHSF